jgi:hypothetical protein
MANKFADSFKKIEENTNIEQQGRSQENKETANPEKSPTERTEYNDNSVMLDVGGVLDTLDTKDRKGRSMTLYLKNEVLERLEVISKEKNISKSKIISAILEKTLLN